RRASAADGRRARDGAPPARGVRAGDGAPRGLLRAGFGTAQRGRVGTRRGSVRGHPARHREIVSVPAKGSMIQIHDLDELELIRASAEIVGRCLLALSREVRPGVTTLELDRIAEKFIRDSGGEPAFKGYRGFPASICASINEEVVHGIPSSKRFLREGDIISLDIGVKRQGFFGDAARTFPVGDVSSTALRLL